jgi:hypothetical protein
MFSPAQWAFHRPVPSCRNESIESSERGSTFVDTCGVACVRNGTTLAYLLLPLRFYTFPFVVKKKTAQRSAVRPQGELEHCRRRGKVASAALASPCCRPQ